MFLDLTQRRNPALMEAAVKLHQTGKMEPDTYLVDLDALLRNASLMLAEADRFSIKCFYMTKQFGRNPLIASHLSQLGFSGAVAVDFREAELLANSGVALGNVGHLVQIPKAKVQEIVDSHPQYITVYSIEKAMEVNAAAKSRGIRQPLLLRVVSSQDILYPGQLGGFRMEELDTAVKAIARLENVQIAGVTSFPCVLFDSCKQDLIITPNLLTIVQAKAILESEGIAVSVINAPSATCCRAMEMLSSYGVTHAEPGHGLLGTTPLHKAVDQPELPAMVYVSEISHCFGGKGYCFGGGHYRRSGLVAAVVGCRPEAMLRTAVTAPDAASIDYHLELEQVGAPGDTVVFAFRSQVFVTRSRVAIAKGIQSGYPEIIGIFDSQGRRIN